MRWLPVQSGMSLVWNEGGGHILQGTTEQVHILVVRQHFLTVHGYIGDEVVKLVPWRY
jgi:hypothetical protein